MANKIHYVFFGSPEFATIILKNLVAAGLPPIAVICNPDRPVGRKQITTPPPIKEYVQKEKLAIEILQPEKPKDIKEKLEVLKPDFAVVAAYSHILKKDILSIPRLGTIGVHPSLLPKYRGATPIQTALLAGETETGVTLYLMNEGVDSGPTLISGKLPITSDETYLSLQAKLAKLGAELLIKIIPDFAAGKIQPKPQNEAEATLTKKFETEDGFIDITKDSKEVIDRKIRALNPEPGAWTTKDGKRVKILDRTTIQFAGKKPQTVPDAIQFITQET